MNAWRAMSSSQSVTTLPGPDGQPSRVFRRGNTVLRPAGPWTPAVHALLRHLERAGFAGSPRVVGDGYDDQGREVLTYIGMVISHCDTGPWNLAARDGLPCAFIDWDTAGPTGRLDEVAATAWWNAQLYDDAAEAVTAQVTPDSADPVPLWALAWRSRSAAWMIRHRALLDNAIVA
jgi:hypothetical protein